MRAPLVVLPSLAAADVGLEAACCSAATSFFNPNKTRESPQRTPQGKAERDIQVRSYLGLEHLSKVAREPF